MRFIITRHTSTDWNQAGRIQGWTDNSISEKGEKEARALAEELKPLGISEIICSDLKRSKETATIISEELNVPVKIDPRIRECSFGEHEGLTKGESLRKYGEKVKSLWDTPNAAYDFRPYGGEERDEVLDRHMRALMEIYNSRPSDQTVLIVGHGRGLATLLNSMGFNSKLTRGEYLILEHHEGGFDMSKVFDYNNSNNK